MSPNIAMKDDKDTVDLKKDIYKLYKGLGSIWCPAIKDNVVFNRYGWNHVSFRRDGHRRYTKDIRLRLHLFKHVPTVIQNSKFVVPTERIIISQKGIKRNAKFFELVFLCAKDNGKKEYISVILRKIEEGKLHYYSVRVANSKIKKALAKAGLV